MTVSNSTHLQLPYLESCCIATIVGWTSIWVLYYLFCMEAWTTDLESFPVWRLEFGTWALCSLSYNGSVKFNSSAITIIGNFEFTSVWVLYYLLLYGGLNHSPHLVCISQNCVWFIFNQLKKSSASQWFITINTTMTWSLVLVRLVLRVRRRSSRSWRVDLLVVHCWDYPLILTWWQYNIDM